MRIKIWGCRGSLPVAMSASKVQDKIKAALQQANGRTFADDDALNHFINAELPWPTANTYGGNSSCVEIDVGAGEYILCDLGSGLREFGVAALGRHGPDKPQIYNVFLSHVHWDHIMGFPFFPPSYIPGNKIRIHSCHPDPKFAFTRQQSAPCFPVDFSVLGADIEFIPMQPGTQISVAGMTVSAIRQYHEGDSYGYRFEKDGKTVIYSTDAEHKQENQDEAAEFAGFFRDADLVIFDAQYSLAEAVSLREDWGHSSNVVGVELCHAAKARHLMLYHHEPAYNDETIHRIFAETIRYEELARPPGQGPLKISSAYDGLELTL